MVDRPPAAQLLEMLRGAWVSQAIHAAAALGIADLLAGQSRSVAELAAATGAHPGALHRLLRALASHGIFAEDDLGRIRLTPLAEPLRRDAPGHAWALFIGAPWHRLAWSELTYSVRTGEPASEHVFGMQLFEYLGLHPEAARVFNDAMTSTSRLNGPAVADAYSFGDVRTLVDVGGGHGLLLATILRANPHLRGILYDLPAVVEGAGSVLDAAGVRARCDVQPGDFFQRVPRGADAYIMKAIIHDWDDDACRTILTNCREAMGDGGRVLVVDCVVPAARTEGPFAKILDLEMLVMTHRGRERTADEFRALFASAGFRLTNIVPTAAPQSIIEGRPA